MELKHFSHEHPLVFINELSHESEKIYCLGCGQLVSGPSFGCVKCGFYLDKRCAEAPSELNHPFHGDHSFNVLKTQPYKSGCLGNFCKQTCENFVYHCSCNLDLHIKCALFSYNIAEKRTAEFQQIARIDPLIATENLTEELKKAQCFVCWKPLLDSLYFSPDCGFYLHAKCADLPAEINHFLHEKHPFILQFNKRSLSCKMCPKSQNPQLYGFVYSCSPCEFALHIECATMPNKINQLYHRKHPLILQIVKECLPRKICQETTQPNDAVFFCSFCKFVLHVRCASSPPVIEDKIHHEHPFILLQRPASICGACGTSGNFVPYNCSTCHLVVHKKCISLPRIIKFYRHQHSLFLKYFLEQREPETWECRFCFEEMNTEHGSYFCSKCNYMVHVNCATKDRQLYYEVDSTENDEDEPMDSRETVNATWIKHFYHQHKLALSKNIWDFKQCDGCLLHIFTSYYYCSQCDFFLHKACAELPMKKHLWFHHHQKLLRLISEGIFECVICGYETSGFAYTCDECRNRICLRCASVSDIPRCQGHEHPLPPFPGYEGLCNACGYSTNFAYRCKLCNFILHHNCFTLPVRAQHKSDVHHFTLAYHDDDNYSESHYCDICEKERNPRHWFYHCATCNNSAHPDCVLGKYSFIKPGSIYTKGDHPHPLTFVRKVHYYPECQRCDQPCLDLALECKTTGCSYIVHWECI